MKTLMFLAVFVVIAVSYSDAIRCYVCSSTSQMECADPDQEHVRFGGNNFKQSCGSRVNYCTKTKRESSSMGQIVTRRCGDSRHRTDFGCRTEGDGTIVCACQGDYCNSAGRFSLPVAILVGSAALAFRGYF